ncbi:valine--tRNA ligase [Trichonephila clavipes]|nr:valine--tRNA ligase [Trichonephila clavipes]
MSVNKDIVTVQAVAEISLYSENSKFRQTDAVEYFKTLLKRNNLITSKCSSSISREAMLMGEELYNYAVDMLAEKNMIHDEGLIHANEVCEEVFFESVEVDSSSDEYEPEEKKRDIKHILLDYKMQASTQPPGQPIRVNVHCTQHPISQRATSKLSAKPKTSKTFHPDEAP